jgi:hypothetical protein
MTDYGAGLGMWLSYRYNGCGIDALKGRGAGLWGGAGLQVQSLVRIVQGTAMFEGVVL